MVDHHTDLSDNVRKFRRGSGLSQEQLAAEAELSVAVIQKLEQGGSVRIETLHAVARALGVTTSALLAEDPPERRRARTRLNLRDLRMSLTPMLNLLGQTPPTDEPNLRLLRRAAADAAVLYPAGRYESLAANLPALVRQADAAVSHYRGDDELLREALLTRSDILALVNRFLTQTRHFDLAYIAGSRAITDAKAAADDLATAARISTVCFTLVRTGRFDEAEAGAVHAMDQIEPRITSAEPDRYAIWGTLAMKAAAAAVRNNRPAEAREYRKAAATAASALGKQHRFGVGSLGTVFGPVTSAMKELEDSMILGDARTVVRRSNEEQALSPRAWKLLGSAGKNDEHRHQLDVARAHVRTGDTTAAMEDLLRLHSTAPTWLQQQNLAVDTWEEIASKRRRALPAEMREVGRHLGIIGKK
ncbi:helix-turn-helix domain-containing protein [Yinghuangia sp. YIM S10712]|uniref:helix-turn-helix domain-containing protein n=1 Tax=Yinghuangia sp. YIM S10712 TaxID=3436930 RepID=UPI003F52F95B